jgi:hypothetical protein
MSIQQSHHRESIETVLSWIETLDSPVADVASDQWIALAHRFERWMTDVPGVRDWDPRIVAKLSDAVLSPLPDAIGECDNGRFPPNCGLMPLARCTNEAHAKRAVAMRALTKVYGDLAEVPTHNLAAFVRQLSELLDRSRCVELQAAALMLFVNYRLGTDDAAMAAAVVSDAAIVETGLWPKILGVVLHGDERLLPITDTTPQASGGSDVVLDSDTVSSFFAVLSRDELSDKRLTHVKRFLEVCARDDLLLVALKLLDDDAYRSSFGLCYVLGSFCVRRPTPAMAMVQPVLRNMAAWLDSDKDRLIEYALYLLYVLMRYSTGERNGVFAGLCI